MCQLQIYPGVMAENLSAVAMTPMEETPRPLKIAVGKIF